jgi:hypothetical protein
MFKFFKNKAAQLFSAAKRYYDEEGKELIKKEVEKAVRAEIEKQTGKSKNELTKKK